MLRRLIPFLVIPLLAPGLFTATAQESDQPDARKNLVGTWRQMSMKQGENLRRFDGPNDQVKLLFITPTHVNRVVHDPKTKKVIGNVGGHCLVEGETYTEIIEFGDEQSIKGLNLAQPTKMSFTFAIDGNRLILKGTGEIKNYSEEWQRLK